MNPKIIPYRCFGGKPLPPLAERCIASWKKWTRARHTITPHLGLLLQCESRERFLQFYKVAYHPTYTIRYEGFIAAYYKKIKS